jgi:hypothetical protein
MVENIRRVMTRTRRQPSSFSAFSSSRASVRIEGAKAKDKVERLSRVM